MELDLTKQLLYIQTEAIRIIEQNLQLLRTFGGSREAIREAEERHTFLVEVYERTWESIPPEAVPA